MKRKLLSIVLAATITITLAIPAFAADSESAATQEHSSGNAAITTGESIPPTGSSITTTESSITTTGNAITTSGASIITTGEAITEKEPAKKLSLSEALTIMTTTGTRAETAELNKKADYAVAQGYNETVRKINKTLKKLDYIDSLPSAYQDMIAKEKFVNSVLDLAIDAQEQGVTATNKEVMALRRDFAKANTDNNYQSDLNQIQQDTINIYNSVLLAEDNYKISLDNLTSQQKNLKNVNAKKAVGLLSKKDVLQAQTALSDAEEEVRTAKTKMEYAHMSFNYLLGYDVLQEVEFTDQLTESTPAAIDVEEAVKNALANRNEIKGADFAKEIYAVLLDDKKAYSRFSSTYLSAQINYLNAEKTAKDARSQIEIDLRNKASDVADKKAALDAAKSLQNYAQEGLRLITLTNEEGLTTVEELLSAQISLYKANLNVANAISEYNLALNSYMDAQGVGTMRIPL